MCINWSETGVEENLEWSHKIRWHCT